MMIFLFFFQRNDYVETHRVYLLMAREPDNLFLVLKDPKIYKMLTVKDTFCFAHPKQALDLFSTFLMLGSEPKIIDL